jgi:hypothetical protein
MRSALSFSIPPRQSTNSVIGLFTNLYIAAAGRERQ